MGRGADGHRNWTLDHRLIQELNDTVSAVCLAQGLAPYQGLSECWQLLGSDVLLSLHVEPLLSVAEWGLCSLGLKMAGYQAWA